MHSEFAPKRWADSIKMFALKRRFLGPAEVTGSGNHQKLGLIGYPNAGKSTLWNALTNARMPSPADDHLFCTLDVMMGHSHCPDSRLDWLASVYRADHVTRIPVTVMDGPGIVSRSFFGDGEGLSFLSMYRDAEIFVNIVRGFDSIQITHYEDGKIDPVRDMKVPINEMMHVDLHEICKQLKTMERQLEDLRKEFAPVGRHLLIEVRTLIKAWECLVGCDRQEKNSEKLKEMKKQGIKLEAEKEIPEILQGIPLRFATWSPVEVEIIKKYNFLSAKEMVYVLNVSPRDHVRGYSKWLEPMRAAIDKIGGGSLIHLSCHFEEELNRELARGTMEAYAAANPTHKSALPDLIFACTRALDLITFYTFTEPTRELKAWVCRQGTTIKDAAGLVDYFLFRNFQRGEVYAYDDMVDFDGNFERLDEFGKHRHQVKQYVVIDGDIITFKAYDKSAGSPGKVSPTGKPAGLL